MTRWLLSAVFILFFWPGNAQTNTKEIEPEKPKERFISNVVFQFDNRREDYFGLNGRMNGLKLGVESYKRYRFGVGFYANGQFYEFAPPILEPDERKSFRMSYTTFWTEVVAFKGFRYEISVPMALGRGRAELNRFTLQNNVPVFEEKDTITSLRLFDLGLNGHYKPVSWLGIGAGFGFRANRGENGLMSDPISSTYFDFKLKLFIGYVYKSIFNKDAIEAERLYYLERKERRIEKFKTLTSS